VPRQLQLALALVFVALFARAVVAEGPDEQAARRAVDRFGAALVRGDVTQLREILPAKGKVQLKLVRMGPEDGFFSSSQVEALLRDFLTLGSVGRFEATRVEYDPQGGALASARVELKDKHGSPSTVGVHLAFQPEGQTWVLREIRETTR
jgi:hypothetical protein